jgi:hypothetical protein
MLLSTRIFDLTETALRLEMSGDHSKFESFCEESAEMLSRFDGIQRVVTSVHGDPSYFMPSQELIISQW